MTKILIADDDLEIQELLSFTLKNEDYQVSIASDGEEAIQKVYNEHPDLIILDIMMPKISGYEVLERLRADPRTSLLPIIMLTSLTPVKDRITGIKLGADEYITKPFDPYELVARIEGLLRRVKIELSANPLTGLPGTASFENKLKELISDNQSFNVFYLDIDNFKSFNDKYGPERGDMVLKNFANILCRISSELNDKLAFVWNLSADDFVLITSCEQDIELITKKIIESFKNMIIQEYDEPTRQRGYFWWVSRNGREVKVPIATLSIGAIKVLPRDYQHHSQIIEQLKEMWKIAKFKEGNSYVYLPSKPT
ncbi:MAG: response regulator [Elusimicrobiota bacterium]|nr:response regulator [Elusimicrobiota bacterium]